jgi:hypothetical protein
VNPARDLHFAHRSIRTTLSIHGTYSARGVPTRTCRSWLFFAGSGLENNRQFYRFAVGRIHARALPRPFRAVTLACLLRNRGPRICRF